MEALWGVLAIQAIIFGGFSAFIASQKDRDSVSWFFLGFFFSLLAVLALIAIPKGNITDQSDAVLRKCPYCAELVKVEATICRFCQKDLPVLQPDSPDLVFSSLQQKVLMLGEEGFSYFLIAQEFNEQKVPIPERYTTFEAWTPELVKLVESEMVAR